MPARTPAPGGGAVAAVVAALAAGLTAMAARFVEMGVIAAPGTPEEFGAFVRREIAQWRIVEVVRVTTDAPGIVGYGETLPHYTWGRVSDAAVARGKGGNAGHGTCRLVIRHLSGSAHPAGR